MAKEPVAVKILRRISSTTAGATHEIVVLESMESVQSDGVNEGDLFVACGKLFDENEKLKPLHDGDSLVIMSWKLSGSKSQEFGFDVATALEKEKPEKAESPQLEVPSEPTTESPAEGALSRSPPATGAAEGSSRSTEVSSATRDGGAPKLASRDTDAGAGHVVASDDVESDETETSDQKQWTKGKVTFVDEGKNRAGLVADSGQHATLARQVAEKGGLEFSKKSLEGKRVQYVTKSTPFGVIAIQVKRDP